ncbi:MULTISPECIES: type IV pilin protein [Thalassolituus]|uniref:type IV pilin protein n=1 Tax=Thalassolituus TaxID=187492 RepID=UPI00042DC331|nr:type IV pilin protein [Thalassolituus oleivorans]AHK15055.1 type 4 fimbrial biogenesis protein PilE [Thalassolituus oleivorans R6-15]
MRNRGFTLIELLVVIAIIAIIAMVAIPQYKTYVMRADRADGITPMQNIMNAQERYFTDNRSYTTNLGTGGLGISASANAAVVSNDYSITAQQCKDTNGVNINLTLCIELKATAGGNQTADGNLYMNTQGRQERIVNEGASDEKVLDF